MLLADFIRPTYIHLISSRIFAASERGEIDAYIIAPSTIYGKGIGPVRNCKLASNMVTLHQHLPESLLPLSNSANAQSCTRSRPT